MFFFFFNELPNDYTVVDIETTPKDGTKVPFQLGALKIRNGKPIDDGYSKDINPECKLGNWQKENTNLSDDYLSTCPKFKDVVNDFFEYIGDDVIVGANVVGSDITPINNLSSITIGRVLDNKTIDITEIAKSTNLPLSEINMDTLNKHFGLGKTKHKAINDCEDEYTIFEIVKLLPPKDDTVIETHKENSNTNRIVNAKEKYAEFSKTEYDGEVLNSELCEKIIVFTNKYPDKNLSIKMKKLGLTEDNLDEKVTKKRTDICVAENQQTDTTAVKDSKRWNKLIYTYDEFVIYIDKLLEGK